jgi:hypothetical protein
MGTSTIYRLKSAPVARGNRLLTVGVDVSSATAENCIHHEKPRRFASSRASARDMLFG